MAKNIESRGVDKVILNRGYHPIGADVGATLIFKKHVVGSEKTPLKRHLFRDMKLQTCLANNTKVIITRVSRWKG